MCYCGRRGCARQHFLLIESRWVHLRIKTLDWCLQPSDSHSRKRKYFFILTQEKIFFPFFTQFTHFLCSKDDWLSQLSMKNEIIFKGYWLNKLSLKIDFQVRLQKPLLKMRHSTTGRCSSGSKNQPQKLILSIA